VGFHTTPCGTDLSCNFKKPIVIPAGEYFVLGDNLGESDDPSLSTSDETLTIEESMTLRARTENAGDVGVEHE
jgi:hypothetical protein